MFARSRVVRTAIAIVTAAHLPTAVGIALLAALVIPDLSKAAQQLAATAVALFASDPQRADRALRVIFALRRSARFDHEVHAISKGRRR
jgi:hypothetical protein